MKVKILSIIGISTFAVAMMLNFNINWRTNTLSDLALASIEALAEGETGAEFTEATCCIACWDNHNCSGCDGSTHGYAHRAN